MTELRYEASGKVTLYECEHITAGTYKMADSTGMATVITTGDNTAIILCVHCTTHLRGQVLSDMVVSMLREKTTKQLLGDEWIEKALETRNVWGTDHA